MAKSDARIREDTMNALQGFTLAGQVKSKKAGTSENGRNVDFVTNTATAAFYNLIHDYPIGTQFDIFIRKRE